MLSWTTSRFVGHAKTVKQCDASGDPLNERRRAEPFPDGEGDRYRSGWGMDFKISSGRSRIQRFASIEDLR